MVGHTKSMFIRFFGGIMLKLMKYLKPFIGTIMGAIILIFIQAITELLLPNYMSDIVDFGIVMGDTGYIYRIGGLMILIAFLGSACSIFAGFLSARVSAGIAMNLRNDIFSQIEGFSLIDINKFGTSSLITRTTNDVYQIQNVVFISLRMIVSAPTIMIGGIIMATQKNSNMSWIFVASVPILIIVVGIISAKGFPLFKSVQAKLDKLNLIIRENISGIRVIRAFDRKELQNKKYDNANTDLTNTSLRVNRIIAMLMPALMLILNLTSVTIVWVGSRRIEKGLLMVGDMMAFIQYSTLILISFVMLSMMFIILPRGSASAARINEVFETKLAIEDTSYLKNADERKGYLEFRNVTYSYPNSHEPAIDSISFIAEPGQVTGIIGSTGSGKSTLVNMILRFYEPTKGQVLVDGVDIREISQQQLREKVGYVPQKAVLFSGTIADNIRYGKETAIDEEIAKAASIAQAKDFIEEKTHKYESHVAQGGSNFSGGQKQRLCIARALVRQPEIYVFDDSFSALDAKTDAKVRAALKQETKNSTVIIVSQKVSSIMNADRIIVLDNGKVAGIGRHKDLILNCEVYQDIVASQFKREEAQ